MIFSFGTWLSRSLRLASIYWAIVFFPAFTLLSNPLIARVKPGSPSAKQIEYVITIVHPGDATARALPYTLVQTLDTQGDPAAYSMWVNSVICRDKSCEVVKVQLHWDALGHYQRYLVAPGSQLTKLDHVPFTDEDLAKLQKILKNSDSPLKEVEKKAMTAKAPIKAPKAKAGSADVAAVSQPTILTLKTAVILGAGYTCYDLWHWSNGLLTEHIRDLTGKDCSKKKLLAYLTSEHNNSAIFALKYARIRRIFDPVFFAAVLSRNKQGSETLVMPTLAYIKDAAPTKQAYYDSIVTLFAKADSKQRLLIVEALLSDKQNPVEDFYDTLCDYLPKLETYYEVHLFLNLMENRNAGSPKVAAQTTKLLKHQKFFVSRRAYAHLKKHQLTPDLQKQVDTYYSRYKDRL